MEDSEEHHYFYVDMCETRLLSADGACRYYLGKLTNSDQFALWNVEFLDNLREYVSKSTKAAGAERAIRADTVGCVEPLLKRDFQNSLRPAKRVKTTKADNAVILLLNHPEFTDQQIADKVPTTLKQLERNLAYQCLRRGLARSS